MRLRDESLVRQMAKSGCMGLLVGFESLNHQNLAAMGKRINRVDEYRAALDCLRRAGVFVYGTFIFGYPHDTPETFDESVQFRQKGKPFSGGIQSSRSVSRHTALSGIGGGWTSAISAMVVARRLSLRPGSVPSGRAMAANEIEAHCHRTRRSFYTWGSIFRRSLEFRTNSPTPGPGVGVLDVELDVAPGIIPKVRHSLGGAR